MQNNIATNEMVHDYFTGIVVKRHYCLRLVR
jgi:hypothetical protein